MSYTRSPEEQDHLFRETVKAKLFKIGSFIAGLGVATIGIGIGDYIANGGEDFEIIAAGYLPLTVGVGTMVLSGIRTVRQHDRQNQS